MKLQVLLFGITADLLQASSLEITIKNKSTLLDLKKTLKTTYSQLKNMDSYAFAINEAYADDTTFLKESDIVAIIPPVSGG